MTPARLRECLAALDLSDAGLGAKVGYSRGAVRNWITGKARVPEPVAAWLERRMADPPPKRAAS